MSGALQTRIAAFGGLLLAAALAIWWLGGTRLALDHGTEASRVAADTLQVLWLTRGMAVALLALRVGTLRGWRSGAMAALGIVAPAWPLVVLAASASTAPWLILALAELLLMAAALLLPLLGLGLRRVVKKVELAEPAGTLLGVAVLAALWFTRGAWALPLS